MIEGTFLRRASLEDMKLLFSWANDVHVRDNSFSTEQISWKEHQKWFAQKMQDASSCIYIYYWKDIPIGQVRVDMNNEKAYIDYSIEERYRGNGHGKNLLCLLEVAMSDEWPQVSILVAQVKEGNQTSESVFQRLGYSKVYIEYEKLIEN